MSFFERMRNEVREMQHGDPLVVGEIVRYGRRLVRIEEITRVSTERCSTGILVAYRGFEHAAYVQYADAWCFTKSPRHMSAPLPEVTPKGLLPSFHARKEARKAQFERFRKGWKVIPCTACAGSGHYDHDGSPPCGACEGSGQERISPADATAVAAYQEQNGSGT